MYVSNRIFQVSLSWDSRSNMSLPALLALMPFSLSLFITWPPIGMGRGVKSVMRSVPSHSKISACEVVRLHRISRLGFVVAIHLSYLDSSSAQLGIYMCSFVRVYMRLIDAGKCNPAGGIYIYGWVVGFIKQMVIPLTTRWPSCLSLQLAVLDMSFFRLGMFR